MRKILIVLLLFVAAVAGGLGVIAHRRADLDKLPKLESGDIILQTSVNSQTLPILIATGSRYSHLGVIHDTPEGYTVIHTGAKVVEVPLEKFVHLGFGEQFVILRYNNLTEAEREALALKAEQYIGTPYNYVFYLQNDGQLYCSELPYRVFNGLNHPLGTLQKIGDLHVNNPPAHSLFKQRWQIHPLCKAPGMTYDACWSTVMDQPVITPRAIAQDPHLSVVYSNYIF